MQASFRIGRIAGVEIGIHYTWLIAFALVTWSLATGFFPQLFPGWDIATYWVTGAVAAILLFASVLVHELAHSFVARSKGMDVHGITLFIFGGVSNLAAEAASAKDEFQIAVVGPLTSYVLAAVFWGALNIFPVEDTPISATLLYLAFINVLLGTFNLIPGFPLDGGRVLRSIIWGITRNLVKATNIAAVIGQIVGGLMVLYGVYQAFAIGNVLSGIWIGFIGWFLISAADASRREVTMADRFRDVDVRSVMDGNVSPISPDVSVDSLVRDLFLRQGRRAAPVAMDGRIVGIATLTDVRELNPDIWTMTPVKDIMTKTPLFSVQPRDNLNTALKLLAQNNLNQLLVLDDDHLVGMIGRADIIRYLQFAEEFGFRPAARA